MKKRKQPPVVVLQQATFYYVFILCLWLRIVRSSDQGVYFMNFLSKIFFSDNNHGYWAAILKTNSLWLLPFFMAVATYCYHEKVRRTMCTAILSYLLSQEKEQAQWSFSINPGNIYLFKVVIKVWNMFKIKSPAFNLFNREFTLYKDSTFTWHDHAQKKALTSQLFKTIIKMEIMA